MFKMGGIKMSTVTELDKIFNGFRTSLVEVAPDAWLYKVVMDQFTFDWVDKLKLLPVTLTKVKPWTHKSVLVTIRIDKV